MEGGTHTTGMTHIKNIKISGFSAISVGKNCRFKHVFTPHSNSNLKENSINLQAMFCGIFGVEFGQHSFKPPE
jgi:hypothetical protein